jgi:hypothetical protein
MCCGGELAVCYTKLVGGKRCSQGRYWQEADFESQSGNPSSNRVFCNKLKGHALNHPVKGAVIVRGGRCWRCSEGRTWAKSPSLSLQKQRLVYTCAISNLESCYHSILFHLGNCNSTHSSPRLDSHTHWFFVQLFPPFPIAPSPSLSRSAAPRIPTPRESRHTLSASPSVLNISPLLSSGRGHKIFKHVGPRNGRRRRGLRFGQTESTSRRVIFEKLHC